jgi:hypothetical protein
VDVLWAAFGPVPWARVLDAGLGVGTAAKKVAPLLNERPLGVALLTREVQEAMEWWEGPQEARAGSGLAWRAPGGYLADLCITARSRNKRTTEERRAAASAIISSIGRSADAMLAGATSSYAGARGEVQEEQRQRAPRSRAVVDRAVAEIDFGGGERQQRR